MLNAWQACSGMRDVSRFPDRLAGVRAVSSPSHSGTESRTRSARKVAKPRRLPTTRRALPDNRLAQINEIAATTGEDPELDTLILRLHTETACRAVDPDHTRLLARGRPGDGQAGG